MEPELSAEVSSSTDTNGGQSAMACFSLFEKLPLPHRPGAWPRDADADVSVMDIEVEVVSASGSIAGASRE